MLLLLSTISALALPAEVQRVLTASDAYDVLQLVPGDRPSVRDLDMARRKLAVKLHPDKHGCPHGPVCDAAGRAMIRVNAAHDELKGAAAQSTHSSSGGHTARPSAFWDQHPGLSEVLRCVRSLMIAALLFHVLQLVDCTALFVKERRRKSGSALRQRWWNVLAALVIGCFVSAGSLISMACISIWLMANQLNGRAAARRRKEACARRISAAQKGVFARGIDDGQEPRGTARSAERINRMWDVISKARRWASLQKSRRVLAALAARFHRRQFKLGFNALLFAQRALFLSFAIQLMMYRHFRTVTPEPSFHTPMGGVNMTAMHQQQEVHDAAYQQLWQGMHDSVQLTGLLWSKHENCSLLMLHDETAQLSSPCADDLTLQLVREAEEAARAAKKTARRAARRAARQAEAAEGAAAQAAAAAHAVEQARALLHRALWMNARAQVEKWSLAWFTLISPHTQSPTISHNLPHLP